jgi:uncharacterized protein (DUF302 family)
MKIRVDLTVENAEAALREALTTEGFGVLTEIDVSATLREKLGVERHPYRILGACNPQLANEALAAEPDVGLLLPCNAVVYTDDEGTVVALIDPMTILDLTGTGSLSPMAQDAKARLQRVLEAVAAAR